MIRRPDFVHCCECGRKREPFRPVVKHADGTVDWVCRQCWKAYDYMKFIADIAP